MNSKYKIFMYLLVLIFIFYFISFLYKNIHINAISNIDLFKGNINEEEIRVCFIDNFNINESKNYNNKLSHGESVINMFQKYLNIDVYGYPYKEFIFNKENGIIMSNCDIINYSMSTKMRDKDYLNNLDEFMTHFKGYLVVASGNKGDTINRSQWSYYKKNNPQEEWLNRLFIIGQGIVWNDDYNKEEKKLNIVRSYGEEVDFIIDKPFSFIKGNYYKGSSFSAPVFSAFLADNIMNNKYNITSKYNLDLINVKNEGLGLNFEDTHIYKVIINSELYN